MSDRAAQGSEAANPPPRRYRPDLDGLRGYAVTVAILFHYGLGLPGGFVGLDLFFVLSGYLIGGILFNDAAQGRFSFAHFYEYRVRRIAPAVLTMLLVSLVVAQFVLLPLYDRYFARSVLANLYFGTNHLFWSEDGYFDPASENKPLLHTWSLAVEEQFYFLFPVVVLMFARWGRKAWQPVIAALALISFAFNIWMTHVDIDGAYFLAPARAWEILLGALIALQAQRDWPLRWRNLMAAVGVALIVYATIVVNPHMPYPGFMALLPCIGSGLLIYAGGAGEPTVSRWIAWRPLRFTGVISYSLYLWHWPVFVFVNHLIIEPLTALQKIALLGLVYGVGWLSWKYVEQPFRAGHGMPARGVVLRAASAAVVVAAGGIAVLATQGAPGRPVADPALDAVAEQYFRVGPCYIESKHRRDQLHPEQCRFGDTGHAPKVLVWGDSYARQWLPGLIDLARSQQASFVMASAGQCPPALGFDPRDRRGCKPANDAVFAWLQAQTTIDTVVLVGRWKTHADEPAAVRGIAASVAALHARGLRVIVVGAMPSYKRPVPIVLAAWSHWHADTPTVRIKTSSRLNRIHKEREAFAEVFADIPVAQTIDPSAALCDAHGCAIREDRQPLYIDQTHLSEYAAVKYAALFLPVFTAAASSPSSAPAAAAAE
jgi:peptidoglycan/LPS O-acetylase OafA/YrhL